MPFVVLEGLDGAGKSTQIELLRGYLDSKGIESEYLHFPRFDVPIYGELVARFLRGEFGKLGEVDPYLVALIFAGDRANASSIITKWIEQGKWVVVDRYIYSNIGYQCAKLEDKEERSELYRWIIGLEYEHYKIPRPDISIFIDVPFAFTEKKLTNTRKGDDRSYLKGAEDIHEASLELQQKVREVYLWIAKQDAALQVVDCSDNNGHMGSPEGNFAKILDVITAHIKIESHETK